MGPREFAGLQQQVASAHAKLRSVGQVEANQASMEQKIRQIEANLNTFSQSLANLTAQGSGDPQHVRYVEQIPGRRIPYDLMVRIPVGANVTSVQQQSTTISQDGPFVAVARFAAFQSAHQFSYTNPENGSVSSFQGRSYGRFRPTHSMWDLNDGARGYQPVVGGALPGNGSGIYASPSNHSNFRTMEFDGLIEFINQGAGFRRQNSPLPSSFYTSEINSPFALGALDYFERGEVLQWDVTPLHANNPSAGNVQRFGATGVFPFLDSQYDVQEGILDEELNEQESDPVQRLPNGILIVGFHGYRIIQPPGTVSLT